MTEATFSVHSGDDVYVYVRGRLVMKRWMHAGVSATFHVNPSGVQWNTERGGRMSPPRQRDGQCSRCGEPCYGWHRYCGAACCAMAESHR